MRGALRPAPAGRVAPRQTTCQAAPADRGDSRVNFVREREATAKRSAPNGSALWDRSGGFAEFRRGQTQVCGQCGGLAPGSAPSARAAPAPPDGCSPPPPSSAALQITEPSTSYERHSSSSSSDNEVAEPAAILQE